MWTEGLLTEAEKEIAALRTTLSNPHVAATDALIQGIVDSLSDDLNTLDVISALNNWIARCESGEQGGDSKALSVALDSLLGIEL